MGGAFTASVHSTLKPHATRIHIDMKQHQTTKHHFERKKNICAFANSECSIFLFNQREFIQFYSLLNADRNHLQREACKC